MKLIIKQIIDEKTESDFDARSCNDADVVGNNEGSEKKREFRGSLEIQCVNGQYLGKSTQQIQAMLTRQLDELQKDGVNAIIFQVRAECDALYKSDLEPWRQVSYGSAGKGSFSILGSVAVDDRAVS